MEQQAFFRENPRVALAFSGGVDSSYLLHAGLHYGAEIRPYYVKTAFQPQSELDGALRFAARLGTTVTVVHHDILSVPNVATNPADRCYYCKSALFGLLRKQAAADGYSMLIDGANASDEAGDRPGMRALCELSVRSPLRECGITKSEVRRLAKEAGLSNWDKPAYACLATRVPTGVPITAELLARVERAEDALFEMGFTDFRVRLLGEAARLELAPAQMHAALILREAIAKALTPDFSAVLLDMAGRQSKEKQK
ncbi:MAG: ATP-dependent sacrificial sulfur transferase LarE [Clostridia bacterium]|nr:ATP-dependent sacrificial sulfur transferase LarE [Clostridia bacterium]